MRLSKRDEQWAVAATSVAGVILLLDTILVGAGVALLATGLSPTVGWVLIGLGVAIFLIAGN